MKKIEKSKEFLKSNINLFNCPVCNQHFNAVNGNQLICEKQHSFDISKKGTLHFLLKQPQNEYDTNMLESRRLIAQDGLWHPLLKELFSIVNNPNGVHLDVGCGEGSHLNHLTEQGLAGTQIGFDISKDAIQLAAAGYANAFWCVADLAQSPFAPESYDTLFNILSPSNYGEFDRILKPGGQLIKVVPSENYLIEIRELIGKDDTPYSNKNVLDKFFQHYPDGYRSSVQYEHTLNPEMLGHLINMTPLGWNVDNTVKEKLNSNPIKKITVEMEILVGEKK